MSQDPKARVIRLADFPEPRRDASVFVAPGAVVVGDVTLAAGVSVWYNAVLRADGSPIVIGEESNLQDGVVCHVDADAPLIVGRRVSAGHNAVLHGCTVEDECLIGMSATVLSGAVIGTGSLVAAGSVVLEGTVVPPGSLVAGVPAKVRRALTPEERDGIRHNAAVYRRHTAEHLHAEDVAGPA